MSNPFDNAAAVNSYQKWYASRGRRVDRLETSLLAGRLEALPDAASVLEVGCGTGQFTRCLAERGFRGCADARLAGRSLAWEAFGLRGEVSLVCW